MRDITMELPLCPKHAPKQATYHLPFAFEDLATIQNEPDYASY